MILWILWRETSFQGSLVEFCLIFLLVISLPNLEEPVSTHWIGYKYEPVDSDPSLSKATDMLKNVIVPEIFHL